MSTGIPWRRRLSELGRGTGQAHAPLFAPLLYGVAAQMEALPPAEVTADPTRLAKNLVELGRVLGTAALVVAAPSALEAEALGAVVDRDTWPPRVLGGCAPDTFATADFEGSWSRSEALEASLEACQRLATTQGPDVVLLAALTGPATLLEQLCGPTPPTAEAWDFAGRALSALAREFAQRGAAAILLCERRAAGDAADAWTAALGTIGNIARFHRIPALLACEGFAPASWPTATVACPAFQPGGTVPALAKPHGLTVAAEPSAWAALPGAHGEARVIVSAREVPADVAIETLVDAVEAALDVQRERNG
jgi:acetophenone carboxylase